MSVLSTHLQLSNLSRLWGVRCLHLERNEKIVPCPPASHPLSKYIYWNREQAQEGRGASKDIHDLSRAIGRNPRIREVGEAVKHEVLEMCKHWAGTARLPCGPWSASAFQGLLTLNSIFIMKISLLWLRNASSAYDKVANIPMRTPNILQSYQYELPNVRALTHVLHYSLEECAKLSWRSNGHGVSEQAHANDAEDEGD